jgi:ABC-type multidrug transport system fused ATPase/permease subunit
MIYQYAQQAGGVIGGMADNFQSFAKTRTDFASAELVWQAPQTPPSLASVPADWQRIDVCDLAFDHAAALPAHAPSAHTTSGQPPLLAERGGLHAVTLTLRRGQRIALVGPSGSGKSTLMRVLAGLYLPQHGHFEVDGVRMVIRFTARTSLLFFCLAFGAAALARIWPNAWTQWQRRNRRYLGVTFAASRSSWPGGGWGSRSRPPGSCCATSSSS